MKTALSILVLSLLACSWSFAQTATPQDEINALKSTVAEQSKAITALREWNRQLDIRMKILEEMKEVRVPRGIKNNLRILQSAMEQYCFEHKITECTFSDLSGVYFTPKTLSPYDGESYSSLRLALDAGEWRIDTSLGFSIVHKLQPFDLAAYEKLIGEKVKNPQK